MPKTTRERMQALWDWGHFRNPKYPALANIVEADLDKLKFTDRVAQLALASWQAFDMQFDTLAQTVHHRAIHPDGALMSDGSPGPVTDLMFELPRCGCPDYGEDAGLQLWDDVQMAIGRGNWPRCHGAADHHRAVGRVSGTFTPHLGQAHPKGGTVAHEILRGVRRGYGEIGLEWIFEFPGEYKLTPFQVSVEFGRWAGSWIGLATVPPIGRSCTASPIFARHQNHFRAGSSIDVIVAWWYILMLHELMHTSGLGHSRGGIGNPSILLVPPRWIGDPYEATMKSLFGGVPVPGWPNFDGSGPDPDTPPNTIWNWEHPLLFGDGKTHRYKMRMEGPMLPGQGYGAFAGNFGKAGPRIDMQVLFQPRASEAIDGMPLEVAI
jgi:hypothetical protein